MGLAREQAVEIFNAPVFKPSEKVRSTQACEERRHLSGQGDRRESRRKGDVGYVRDIGVFLQQFYIYAVDFADRAVVVGMRGKELASVDNPPVKPEQPAAIEERAP